MEGYWDTLNCKPIKRRLMIAALQIGPPDLPELQQFEDASLYDADRLARSGGWIRPLAIRATQGHSFSGGHKRRLCVNIDQERMNMKLTKELSFKLAGGYHATWVENLSSDHVFFGEYAPWHPLNSSTLAYLGSDANFLLVLYVPTRRLLKYTDQA